MSHGTRLFMPFLIALWVLTTLVVASCQRPGQALPELSVPTLAPSGEEGSSPTPLPSVSGDCYRVDLNVEPIHQSIANLSRYAPVVIAARFQGYGESFWNTPDRSRPSRTDVESGNATISTSLLLDEPRDIRAGATAASRAVLWGGTVGCDKMTTDLPVSLVEGQRYVLFLHTTTDSRGAPSTAFGLMEAWLIRAGDVVETRHDGELSLDRLEDILRAGAPVPTLAPAETPDEPSGAPYP